MAKRKTGNDTIARKETLRHQKLIIKKRREKKVCRNVMTKRHI